MSITEHVRCRFELSQTGNGHPLLQIEFIERGFSGLEKPPRRIFFSFTESTAWDDAEALVAEMNKKIHSMAITEYAHGELGI